MRSTGTPVRVCREPAPLVISRSEAGNYPPNHPETARLEAQAAAKEAAANAAHAAIHPKP
jgi:hypothetical protein